MTALISGKPKPIDFRTIETEMCSLACSLVWLFMHQLNSSWTGLLNIYTIIRRQFN